MIFTNRASYDISKYILQVAKKIIKDTEDKKILNCFFIELYDMLYYYIIFGKIKIAKKILRLFEGLALPINSIGDEKRKEIIKKIKKMRA